jgi:opacity protein-like surface antigen
VRRFLPAWLQAFVSIRPFPVILAVGFLTIAVSAQSPDANPSFTRKNTLSVLAAYSNDSSHILLGDADNRKLLDFGLGYNRRLFTDRIVNWQYSGELLPVALESDPVMVNTVNWTSPTVFTESASRIQTAPCVPSSGAFSSTLNGKLYSYTYSFTCSRRWTIGEGISPVGFQWNFLPRQKMQPFFTGHGGYIYSTQPIPITSAGSFNFTFDLGAGIELYRSKTRSVRAEYRYHHISNHDTAPQNPGIDNGLFQVTYSFGR